MTTANDLKRVLLESLVRALNESQNGNNSPYVNNLCDRLDQMSSIGGNFSC